MNTASKNSGDQSIGVDSEYNKTSRTMWLVLWPRFIASASNASMTSKPKTDEYMSSSATKLFTRISEISVSFPKPMPKTMFSHDETIVSSSATVLETQVQGARLGDELVFIENDEVDGDQRNCDGDPAEEPGARLENQVDQHQRDPCQAEGEQHGDFDDARAQLGWRKGIRA